MLCFVAFLLQETPADLIDRLEARVAAIRDFECTYSTDIPPEDAEYATLGYRTRLAMVRGKIVRIDAYRPRTGKDDAPLSIRYRLTPDALAYEFSTPEPSDAGDGLPLPALRFRIRTSDPSFRKLDPFLSPPEYPARLFFDDPLLLATVAPREILSIEPDLRVSRAESGWILESSHSYRELARARGIAKFGVAANRRRYFVDEKLRIARVEWSFAVQNPDEAAPLLVYTARQWQDMAGVSLPSEIEIGFGELRRDGSRQIDRKRTKRITDVRANAGLAIPPDDDVAADALLRTKKSEDAEGRYTRILSRLMTRELFSGLGFGRGRGHVDPDELQVELLRCVESRPDSAVLRTCFLFAEREEEDFPEQARKMEKGVLPDFRAWLYWRSPDLSIALDPAALSDGGRDLWTAARLRNCEDRVTFLRKELSKRSFPRRVELVSMLDLEPDLESIPLVGAFRGKSASLAALAEDPEAAGFVLARVREWDDEELAAASAHLERALELAEKARPGDPEPAALRGRLALRSGAGSEAHFDRALKLASAVGEDSPWVQGAFRAAIEAAQDEAHRVEAADLFLRLASRLGRPAAAAFNDPERSPVLLLVRLWGSQKKFAELYRKLRAIDWSAYRYFAGVRSVLQSLGAEEEFIRVAMEECRKGGDVLEHAALARLLRDQFRRPDTALELLKESRKDMRIALLYAETARKAKNLDAALEGYRAAGGPESTLAVAEIELDRKRPEAAREALRGVDVERDPDVAERAGALWAKLGEVDLALGAYLAAEKRGRGNDLAVGRLYERKSDFREAMRRYNRAIASGENDPGFRFVDPRQETSGEKAKRELYRKIGEDYFLRPFLARTFAPLPKENEERLRKLLASIDEEATDEIRAMGPDAAPIVKPHVDDPAIRKILLEWAEP